MSDRAVILPFPIRGFVLRSMRDNDLDYFIGCMRSTVLNSVTDAERDLGHLWIDLILNGVQNKLSESDNETFVLENENGNKAGILWLGRHKDQYTSDDTGYILGIYVEEELRGKGLGRGLMNSAEEWCRQKGFLSLTLNVGALNTSARPFYDSLGFAERSVVMRKSLR